MTKVTNVLSLDGGGIRGIIPAMVLAEIENRTQKQISELFQLIGGTSTGGILALALTRPDANGKAKFHAQDIVKLYENEGSQIFSRSVWHRIRSVGNLVEEKYPADGIENVLSKYFAESRLKDAITNVIVTSYEIERRIPWFFKSHKAKDIPGRDYLMTQVARATSAAPTYFEPAKITLPENGDYVALVDGGVFANNPAMCSYVEAKTLDKESDVLLVSLGTGELTRRLPYDDVKGWGLAQFIIWKIYCKRIVISGFSYAWMKVWMIWTMQVKPISVF